MEAELAYLLNLRPRVRGNAEATAIIDRCLRLIARAQDADAETYRWIDLEVAQLADDLTLRFGAPNNATVQETQGAEFPRPGSESDRRARSGLLLPGSLRRSAIHDSKLHHACSAAG